MSNINMFQVSGKVIKIDEKNKFDFVEFILQQEKTYQNVTKQVYVKLTIKNENINFKLDDLILVSGTVGGKQCTAKNGGEFYNLNLYANTVLFLKPEAQQPQSYQQQQTYQQQAMKPMQTMQSQPQADDDIPF